MFLFELTAFFPVSDFLCIFSVARSQHSSLEKVSVLIPELCCVIATIVVVSAKLNVCVYM